MKIYTKRTCWVCGKLISSAGFAWISHNRKHVRERILKEIRFSDGTIDFLREDHSQGRLFESTQTSGYEMNNPIYPGEPYEKQTTIPRATHYNFG